MAVIVSTQARNSALTYRTAQPFHYPALFIYNPIVSNTASVNQNITTKHGFVSRGHGAVVAAAPLVAVYLSFPATAEFDAGLAIDPEGVISLAAFSYAPPHTVRHGPPGRRMHGGGTTFAAPLVAMAPYPGTATAGEITVSAGADATNQLQVPGVVEFDGNLDAVASADPIQVPATAEFDAVVDSLSSAPGTINVPGTSEFDAVLTEAAAGVPTLTGTASETITLTSAAALTLVTVPGTASFSTSLTTAAAGTVSVSGTAQFQPFLTEVIASPTVSLAGTAEFDATLAEAATGASTSAAYGSASATDTLTAVAAGTANFTSGTIPYLTLSRQKD